MLVSNTRRACRIALAWLATVTALMVAGVGCGSDSEFGDTDLSSGDEVEADGIAKAMPPGSAQASQLAAGGTSSSGSQEPTILRPQLDAIPSVGAAGPPPPPTSGSSEWGDPEGETGKPLPQRTAVAGGAKSAYQQGLDRASKGDLTGAQQALEQAYRADPKSPEILFALGVVADRSGQANQALAYYRKALSYQPDYERAVDGAVKLFVRGGDTNAAVRFAEPVAREWERNLSLQTIYAEALIAAGRLDEAEKVARSALRRDERFVPAMIVLARASLARGREELAASILEQAAAIDGNHPEIHYLQGLAAAAEDQTAEAMRHYKKAVAARPEYAEARTALGRQYMASGNYSEALKEFEAAAKLVPMLAEAHLNLGDAYRATRRWADAKREFELSLRMNNNLAAVHFNMGLMYMVAGGDFPGLALLDGLRQAMKEFNAYRSAMGARLPAADPVNGYLEDLARQIEREEKRLEREARRKAQGGG